MSTLLRVMGGLETPTSGTVSARSTPVLLGVNAALVPELSGERNVRLGCLAMGLTPQQIEAIIPQVIELAGIGKAIYRPMKTYSSGMSSRLRFAIAAAANPDILLIDEALSTGDAAFKERSENKMTELRRAAGTGAPDWGAVSAAVSNAVVSIAVATDRGEALGSGVIFDKEGHIITNNHVVAGASEIQVTLADGRVYDAEATGTDPATDLAVIQLKDAPDNLTVAQFGDSDKLATGQDVMAIGNPLGLSSTATTGIISAKHQYTLLDYTTTVLSLIGVAMPNFWFGLLVVLIFSMTDSSSSALATFASTCRCSSPVPAMPKTRYAFSSPHRTPPGY